MFKGIYYTHLISVIIFLLIYVIKTILLLVNKEESLVKFTKAIKVPEIIVSTLFLVTGIYMLFEIPEIKSMLIIKIVLVFASIPVAVVGFKKRNKVLAVISLLMIIAAYGLAEMSKKQKSSSSSEPVIHNDVPAEATNSGHDIFMDNCARCHGEDGKLSLMGSPDLSASTMEMDAKIETIKKGKGAMAGFETMLTEAQIKAVAEYTESLKK
ncbi:MAG TPA: cytochrome c [Bacteroidia bacterium]